MMPYPHRIICGFCTILCLVSPSLSNADVRDEFFEKRVRPLLVQHCVECHGPNQQEGGLRLDSRTQVVQGTEDLAALVVPGDPPNSRLIQVLQYSEDDVQMPPEEKLPAADLKVLTEWVQAGAVWPDHAEFGKAIAHDPEAWKRHWAFQPVSDPPKPPIGDDNWHPIDAFIRFPLQQKGLPPSPLADARTLARRISYAITGLPPDRDALAEADSLPPQRVFGWANDYTDRLLNTPQFGERWARYWLDVSRYADTKGYVFREDREYKEAWRYREWVIQSLNSDMPYDEFLKRQIAADQLPGHDDPAQLAAMGFLTLGRRFLNNKHDIIDDRIDVVTRGTMGLTVTCARCHDHKFDPIPTADYYSLYGVFDSSDEPKDDPSPLRLVDREKPREPVVFIRGSAGNRGPRVTRHFLTALSDPDPAPFQKGSGRLELAEDIASPDNPLTARVAVNRIWMRLFGRGLVESPSDFGVRTPPPSHPELLDHLTTYFIRHQWSRKQLIRYITRSWTWRQSSAARPDADRVDPENRLLARRERMRLDFEAFRDSLLAVSDHLDATVGGPSVDITTRPFPNRRTVYARIDRQNLPGLFRTFDFASPDAHAPKRYQTTVPQQALFQFNSPFMMEQAARVAAQADADSEQQKIRQVYQQVLMRDPAEDERTAAAEFLRQASSIYQPLPTGWHYGWAEMDESRQRVLQFHPLPVFHEGSWKGGQTMPDATLGWCSLTATGGHPGGDSGRCVVRRWVADVDSQIDIASAVQHKSEQGDGIRAILFVDGKLVAEVSVAHGQQRLDRSGLSVLAGQAVDFVTECRDNEAFDSFQWRIQIRQASTDGQRHNWNSELDFSGRQPPRPLTPLAQLAQTLMMTNEFSFVD